jgi:hypothetical protein
MFTAQQEKRTANGNKKKQDSKVPFLINTLDARLIPNTVGNRRVPDYRPYTGDVNAAVDERMKWLHLAQPYAPRRHVEAPEDFDVATAKKEELLTYAREELGMADVNEDTDVRTLRKQVKDRYEAAFTKLS